MFYRETIEASTFAVFCSGLRAESGIKRRTTPCGLGPQYGLHRHATRHSKSGRESMQPITVGLWLVATASRFSS